MTRRKAFVLGMVCTLALLAPCYGLLLVYSAARTAPADAARTDVPLLAPTEADEKNLLVMTGEEAPETFALVRLDALHSAVNVVAMPGSTVVLCDGAPYTLLEAARTAGPAQAAAALEETLGIHVDNYVFCTAAQLAEQAEPLGNGRLRLANYLSAQALEQLRLAVPGVTELSLTPAMLAQALAEGQADRRMEPLLRAAGYLAFLQAGQEKLAQVVPEALRYAIAHCTADLDAAQVYDYQRVCAFLAEDLPRFSAAGLPGTFAGEGEDERYELGAAALATARQYLAASARQGAGAEDPD